MNSQEIEEIDRLYNTGHKATALVEFSTEAAAEKFRRYVNRRLLGGYRRGATVIVRPATAPLIRHLMAGSGHTGELSWRPLDKPPA